MEKDKTILFCFGEALEEFQEKTIPRGIGKEKTKHGSVDLGDEIKRLLKSSICKIYVIYYSKNMRRSKSVLFYAYDINK